MKDTVRIKMLGNVGDFLNGEVYEVEIAKANALTGLGMAVLVESDEPEEE